MWGGYAADDYQQWSHDRSAFVQYPVQAHAPCDWEDNHWYGEPPAHDLRVAHDPRGQFPPYDVVEDRMRMQHHPAGDLAMRRFPVPVASLDKRSNPVQMSASGKGILGPMPMAGKGAIAPKVVEKKRSPERPDGNAMVIVKQLFGPEKKLGLNLRGVKVETFSEYDASTIGWKKGDVITAVNGVKVSSFDEFNRAFDKAKQGLPSKPIQFRVQRSNDAKSDKGHSPMRSDMRTPSRPFSFQVNVMMPNWCISGMEYVCTSASGVAILNAPGQPSARSGVIEPREKFIVSTGMMGSDQRMYLKLADDRGWVVDDGQLMSHVATEKMKVHRHHDEYERLSINLRRLREAQIARK